MREQKERKKEREAGKQDKKTEGHCQRFLYNEIHYLLKKFVETIQRSIEVFL